MAFGDIFKYNDSEQKNISRFIPKTAKLNSAKISSLNPLSARAFFWAFFQKISKI